MVLEELITIIKNRKDTPPEGSYVASLFKEGKDRIAQKVGEEAVEVIIASKNTDKSRMISELSDLFFHTLILMVELGISIEEIEKELYSRKKSK